MVHREKSIFDAEISPSTHGLKERSKFKRTDETRRKISEHAKKVWAARRDEYERRLQAGETGSFNEVLGLRSARKMSTVSKPVINLVRACLGRWQVRWDNDGFLLNWNPPQALRDFGPAEAMLRVRTALKLPFDDEAIERAYDRERRAVIKAAKQTNKSKRRKGKDTL